MNPSRRQVLRAAGALGFTLLTGATLWQQIVAGPELSRRARAERTVTWVNKAARGDILAADGTVLATSTISYDIGVNQPLLAQYEHTERETDPATGTSHDVVVGHGPAEAARLMAPLLDADPQELGAKMVGESTYAVVAANVDPDTWRKINALAIPGVEPDQRTRRSYPAGTVAGNVVGYTYEAEGRRLTGSAGLELTQDAELTGVDGQGSVEVGKSGAIIPTGERQEVPARAGSAVRTTLDADLQAIAQDAINEVVDAQGARWGTVVVMEPATGKVLVAADSHSVDPSDPAATPEADRGARVVQAVFEPGSVGKVITFAAALEEGRLRPEDTFTVPYQWTAPNGQQFQDSHEHATEQLTASQVLAESSNVGTVQIGDRLDNDTRHRYIVDFGYGQLTGIELPGESAGLITQAEDWDGRTRYTTMFGQGFAGTTLQAVQVLATVANGGVRVPPRVVDAWVDADGKEAAQEVPEGEQVISQQTAATLTDMLVGVTQKGGTAEAASIDGYLVAGKTGTTEILTESGTVASFVGFTPAKDPAIAVAVVVYQPAGTYGGTVAAPVFRKVALAAMHNLGIPPDPGVVASQEAARVEAEVTGHGAASASATATPAPTAPAADAAASSAP